MIDFVLKESHKKLVKALDQAIAEVEQDGEDYSNSMHVLATVGRFVDALGQVPGGSAELERRASLIENFCAQWPEYRRAAADAAGFPGIEPAVKPESAEAAETAEETEAATNAFARAADAETGWFDARNVKKYVRRVVTRLMRDTLPPPRIFRADVDRDVAEIELVLEVLPLDDTTRRAFDAWLAACYEAQHASNGLAVDGCWHMRRFARERALNPAKRGIWARTFDGCWLRYIRRAANSLKKWAKDRSAPGLPPPKDGQGCQKEADKLGTQAAAAGARVARKKKGDPNKSRDTWIYNECCKGTPYKSIVNKLKKKPASWEKIESEQGIRQAALRYAEKNSLTEPPSRHDE